MISSFSQIEELFNEVEANLEVEVHVFVIGGVVLLRQGMKDATKDVDLIAETRKEFNALQDTLKRIGFKAKIPTKEYEHMNISQIFIREDFRIDLFYKTVCKGFSLSKEMAQRANLIIRLKHLKLSFCSNEDVFLFKTMTEREGDLADCLSLARRNLEWNVILAELKNHACASGNDVWITWVGERLDLLEEKGMNIPVMKDINKMRDDYFTACEKKLRDKPKKSSK